MDRVRKIFQRVHITAWLLLSLLVGFQLKTDQNAYWFATTCGFVLTGMYAFYGHFLLLTHYAGKKQRGSYLARLAVVLLTAPLIYLVFHYYKLQSLPGIFSYYWMVLLTIVLLFTLLGWLARITETLVLNTIKKEQLEKQAAEAELTYLKAQINPHFLFNTLNNIHTLVYKQSPLAPDAVMQLSSLMRYMIYESNAATVPLEKEIAYLQDYMSLQQLRYRQQDIVDMQVAGNMAGYFVAPLLFIHLLENAYKHSPALLQPGALKLALEVKDATLTFSVENPVGKTPAGALEAPGGIGLQNVQKRLALLYPGQHSLDIHNSGDRFKVLLRIHGLQSQPHERKADLLHY